jgi:hypothetical protein
VLREDDQEQRWFHGLAIARYRADTQTYLFYCDTEWETKNDSLYSSPEEAVQEAYRQFGVSPEDWRDSAGASRSFFRYPPRPFQAVVWPSSSDSAGLRVTIHAATLAEAEQQLLADYGADVIYTLHNEEDAAKPR